MENRTPDSQIADLVRETEFGDDPGKLWDQAVKLATDEETRGYAGGSYGDLGVGEIVAFGEKIRKAESIEEKYGLLLGKTESGKLWYDVMLGDANMTIFAPVEEAVKKRYGSTDTKWARAADIGCGTGNILRSIASYVKSAVGVDLSSPSLRSARDIGLPDNASLVQGDAQNLPFADRSLDLVISNGLIYYLSPDETRGFVRELSRILSGGGKFYNANVMRKKDEIVPGIFHETLESGKAALINLIARLANGGGHPESLGMKEFHDVMLENSFAATDFNQDAGNRILIEYTRR